jgi:hypothetical protein
MRSGSMRPEYGDLKTIGFAKLLAQAGFAFTLPPGYETLKKTDAK